MVSARPSWRGNETSAIKGMIALISALAQYQDSGCGHNVLQAGLQFPAFTWWERIRDQAILGSLNHNAGNTQLAP